MTRSTLVLITASTFVAMAGCKGADAAPEPAGRTNTFQVSVDGAPFLVTRCNEGTVRIETPGIGVQEIGGYWLADAGGRQLQVASNGGVSAVTVTEPSGAVTYLNDACSVTTTSGDGATSLAADCRGAGRHVIARATIQGCDPLPR